MSSRYYINVAPAVERLRQLFERFPVDAGHGLIHAIDVMNKVKEALKCYRYGRLKKEIVLACKLAALGHDADDHKFFPDSVDYQNAKAMLEGYSPQVRELAMKMIRLVSCSVNGNSTADLVLPQEEYMLYPRWADRLTALGRKGIWRCRVYSITVNRPLYTPETPRVTNMEELAVVAPPERFQHYIDVHGKVGLSDMISHYYDKLVHLRVPTNNSYLESEFEREMEPIYQFLFDFGRSGYIDPFYFEQLDAEFESAA